ncbi:MAG: Gfo/Idh/MocA family oxidoreductase [Actinobacteria bacterium]|nr:Gfo/Idh/MocA family oxidoreductase [Actinomycetota bacterium]
MGRAHSIGYSIMPLYFWPPPAMPIKEVIVDVTEDLAKKAAERLGFNRWTTKWEDVINDNNIDIVDITAPNYLHKPIAIAAAKAGKHIFCEKPLAMNGKEAKEIYEVVEKSKVKHMVGFNYRKIPAVEYAKQLIEEGKLGEISHFRGFYINDWATDPDMPISWRFQPSKTGSGVVGDQGSHIFEMSRYLLGEFKRVIAQTDILLKERPFPASSFDTFGKSAKSLDTEKMKINLEDKGTMLVEFESGLKGTIEVSRMGCGHRNYLSFEISGTKGSIYFNWERNNEIKFFSTNEPYEMQGYKVIQIGPDHPRGKAFWPIPGINIGFSETFAIEFFDFISGIIKDKEINPNFGDGVRICEIVDAALRSVVSGKWEECRSV